jgi:pyruvate kinase
VAEPRLPLQRRTRIVATVGPATSSPAAMRALLRAGVDVVRQNFSHESHAFHRRLYETVRRASAGLERPVAVLQDLSGPKMRLGRVQDDVIELRTGRHVRLDEGGGLGTCERLAVEAAGVLCDLAAGDRVRLADGEIELVVSGGDRNGVECRIVQGGQLRSRQGLHIPGTHRRLAVLTPKDRRDLKLGLELGVDAIALSFVRDADDVLAARRLLPASGPRPLVIAKIERAEALANVDSIAEVADGLMVARGDLGIEIGVERVPLAQARIISAARRHQKPVITATQMLESMIEHNVPTRAEVSDVAHAVLQGTDALMLSAETAIGAYPVEAVATLDRIARQVEEEGQIATLELLPTEIEDVPLAMARAARIAARAVRASAVAAFTDSGHTARLVSSQRPRRLLFGITYRPETWRQMAFYWGITPLLIPRGRNNEAMIAATERMLLRRGLVHRGEAIVIVAGERLQSGATNTIRVHTLGTASKVRLRASGSGGRPRRRAARARA